MTSAPLARQLLAELWRSEHLDSPELAEAAIRAAALAGPATLIQCVIHRFAPYGVSALGVIAESHISIHTWPERGYAAVDIFSCADIDLDAMLGRIAGAYAAGDVSSRLIERGVTPSSG